MRISDWSSDVCSSDLFGHRRPRVGLGPRAAAQGDQRVGLLDAGGEQAAWAVVLEAATVEVAAAGEQRGGEGVAGEALVAPPLECEAARPAAVHEAAAVEPKAAHAPPPSPLCSAASPG